MNYKGVLKRLLPFAATFAVAVFITSFFVDLHRPGRFAEFRMRRYQECQRLRFENEELKNENLRLRNELENRRTDDSGAYGSGSGSGSGIGSGYGGGSSSMEGLRLMVPAPPMPAAPGLRILKLRHNVE